MLDLKNLSQEINSKTQQITDRQSLESLKTFYLGKRHGMIKRTNSQIRKLRGTTILSKQDAKIIKSYMPNSLRG